MSVVDIFAAMRREAMKAANCQQVRKGPKWGRLKPKAENGRSKEQVKPLSYPHDHKTICRMLKEAREMEQKGLYGKYIVHKADTGEEVADCFVLRPMKDPAAVAALREYARVTENKALAADIVRWIGPSLQIKPMVKFKRLDPTELPVELQDIKPSDVKPLLPERDPAPEDLFVASKVVCKRCYRKWLAVRLAETPLHVLECPECGPGYVEETGDNIIV